MPVVRLELPAMLGMPLPLTFTHTLYTFVGLLDMMEPMRPSHDLCTEFPLA